MELFREPPDVHVTGFSTNTLAPLHMDGMQLQWGFFKNGISCTAKLLDEKQNIIAEESWNSRTIKWNVPNAKGAKICSITASDGKVERTFQHEISFRFDPPVNPVKSGYRIWIEDSMVNVSPLTTPPKMQNPPSSVELAGGEHEAHSCPMTASNQAPWNGSMSRYLLCAMHRTGVVRSCQVGTGRRLTRALNPRTASRRHPGRPDHRSGLPHRESPSRNATQGLAHVLRR